MIEFWHWPSSAMSDPGTFRTTALVLQMSAIGGKLRKDVWAASPSVGHALVSGIDPRPEPPLAGVSAHSGNDRCRIMRLSFRNPPLPGPRFCPESALRHAP
jgi:hypothetical protein